MVTRSYSSCPFLRALDQKYCQSLNLAVWPTKRYWRNLRGLQVHLSRYTAISHLRYLNNAMSSQTYKKYNTPLYPCFCGNSWVLLTLTGSCRFCRFWNIYPRSCKNDVSYKLPCLQCKLLDMFTNNTPCLQ